MTNSPHTIWLLVSNLLLISLSWSSLPDEDMSDFVSEYKSALVPILLVGKTASDQLEELNSLVHFHIMFDQAQIRWLNMKVHSSHIGTTSISSVSTINPMYVNYFLPRWLFPVSNLIIPACTSKGNLALTDLDLLIMLIILHSSCTQWTTALLVPHPAAAHGNSSRWLIKRHNPQSNQYVL